MKLTRKIITSIVCFFFLSIILLIVRCEEEKPVTREYPRLTGTSVINISDSGATFSADLYSMGTEIPEEYGFLWDTWGELNYIGSNKAILGKPVKTGVFTADISSALIKDREYTVRPYVKTEDHVVYGPVSTFKSLGSRAPVICGFYPDSAGWGDTVKVSGKNFSYVTGTNEVKLNQISCLAVKSTDTTLFFIVDPTVASLKNIISVELAGNINRFIKDTFRLIPPRILDFNPRNAWWGDTIIIRGKNLEWITLNPTNYVKLGTMTCTRIGNPSDTLLKIKVPYELTEASNNVIMNNNGLLSNGPVPFTLLPPYYVFSPAMGVWGTTVTLEGRFNTITSRNKIFFDSYQATISSVTPSRMVISVPNSLADTKSVIKYSVTPFSISSVDSFCIFPTIVKSFSPLSGPSGTLVTIKGKYFNTTASNVKFGDTMAQITSRTDSTIIAKVPPGINDACKITVTNYSQLATFSDGFLVTNPKISQVYPLYGTFDDEITITGENFIPPSGSTLLSFGGLSAAIVSITNTQIVARIPQLMDSIPRIISVQAGANSAVSTDKVTLVPHVINSSSPGNYDPDQDVIISGQNFNPNSNYVSVYWGTYPLTIKSATKNEIHASWPLSLTRGNMPLKIIIGGYKRYSPASYLVSSQWYNIELPSSFIWTSDGNYSPSPYTNTAGIFFSVKDRGYMIEYINARLTSFYPASSEFTDLGEHAIFKQQQGLSGVNNLDTFYLAGRNSGFLRYDVENNTWIKLCNMPNTQANGILFSLGGKIYFGLTSTYTLNSSFWIYDPEMKNWISKSAFPFTSSDNNNVIAYFNDSNYGYVLFRDKKFCKYDPATDSWTQLASFPTSGITYERCTFFALNNKLYVGLGYTSGASSILTDNFWIYDPILNNWSVITNIPRGYRYNAIAFTVNNMAYIGLGVDWVRQKRDFYEFDPNFPLK